MTDCLFQDREADLWVARTGCAGDSSPPGLYRELLSDAELRRADAFVFEKDRRQYLIAHALLRQTLSQYVAIKPRQWVFAANAYGKPFVRNPEAPDLRFNLSHTNGCAAVAVSPARDVGVDIENVTRDVPILDFARDHFALTEVEYLQSLPKDRRHDAFFHLWTLKEAYIKARGLGLSIPLKGFAIHFDENSPISIRFSPGIQDDPARWRFFHTCLEPSFPIAIAARIVGAGAFRVRVSETTPAVSSDLRILASGRRVVRDRA